MPLELEILQKPLDRLLELAVEYSVDVVGALVVLSAGFVVARWMSGAVLRVLQRRNFDVTLTKLVVSMTRYVIIGFAVIVALGKFGMTIAPIIAALGAAAFGVSFAIQGPASNYGAGLVIVFTRPFVVGDTIFVAGVHGIVQEVKLGFTLLTDEDGVKIIVPNKLIVGEVIQNSRANRVIEATVGISYDDDPKTAIQVVEDVLNTSDGVTRTPPAQVGIEQFGDSSVNIGFRYWVPADRYFNTMYAVNLAVYTALGDAGISIPFPQRDVHLKSPKPSAFGTEPAS